MIYLLMLTDKARGTGISAYATEAERMECLVAYAVGEYGDDEGFPTAEDIAADPSVVTDYLDEVSDPYELDEQWSDITSCTAGHDFDSPDNLDGGRCRRCGITR